MTALEASTYWCECGHSIKGHRLKGLGACKHGDGCEGFKGLMGTYRACLGCETVQLAKGIIQGHRPDCRNQPSRRSDA